MLKKRIVCLLFIGCAVALSSAQSISEIKGNKDYIWGEGKGVTLTEADKEALNDLITQISVTVESKYSKIDENVVAEEGVSTQSSFKAVLQTYSNATLQNTERFVLSNEPDAHVFRFVKKSDVDRIFASRKAKVNDMVAFALRAQKERKIDEALRNFYWAYCLLQSLPSSHEITYDNNGEACLLMTWIPEQIRKIFSSIKIMRQPASDDGYDDMIVLNITYAGEPISSFDYTYFDGRNWSNIYSAKDGLGVIELLPGMATDNDLLRVDAKRSEIRYQLQKARNGANLCRLALCSAIGCPLDTEITPTDTVIAVRPPAGLDTDISQRPELRLLRQQVTAAEQQVKDARSGFLPQIGLSAGYLHYGNIKIKGTATGADGAPVPYTQKLDDGIWLAMLSVNIPVFHWGEGGKQVEKARLGLRNSQLDLQKNTRLLDIEARQAALSLADSYALVETATLGDTQATENLRVMRSRYLAGMCSLTDLLDAQSQWQQARGNLIEARTQHKINETEYLRVTGRLE